MMGSPLDSVLDRTMIGGYTNIGYRIRSRGWSASELGSLDGRVVMVTGSTSASGSPPWTALRASARLCGSWSEAKRAVNRHAPQRCTPGGLTLRAGVEISVPRFYRLARPPAAADAPAPVDTRSRTELTAGLANP